MSPLARARRLPALLPLLLLLFAATSAHAAFPGANGKIVFSRCEDGSTCQVGHIWSGASGNDKINVANGKKDSVNCGKGRDSVRADRVDKLTGCERVRRRR
jgi:hypothetical protein